jgi:hypothetical protein
MTRLGIASPPEPFARFFQPNKIEILRHLNDPSMSMVSLMRDYLGTYRDHPMTREEEKLLNAHISARSLSRTLKYLRTASQHERLVAAYATEAWRYYLMRIFRTRQGRLLTAQAIRATQAEWQRNVRHHSRRCLALHDRFQRRRAKMIKNAMRRSDREAQ